MDGHDRLSIGRNVRHYLIYLPDDFLTSAVANACVSTRIEASFDASRGDPTLAEAKILLAVRSVRQDMEEPAAGMAAQRANREMSSAEPVRTFDPMSISVLASSGPEDVSGDPFSHLVRTGCLPSQMYENLAASFPSSEVVLGGRRPRLVNAAARLPAFKVLENPAIEPAWREFFAFHTSDRFWKDVVRVFGGALRATYQDLERRAGKELGAWRAGPRGSSGDLDVQLDCQFVVNTPWPARRAARASWPQRSVKAAHVDKRDTLFSALLYFRDPDDAGTGGDLELYAWNHEPRFLKPRVIVPSDIELRAQVPYAANTLVAFVNSARAAHGVTPRAPSPLPRRYINFIVEVPFRMFETTMFSLMERIFYWPHARWLGSRDIGGDRY